MRLHANAECVRETETRHDYRCVDRLRSSKLGIRWSPWSCGRKDERALSACPDPLKHVVGVVTKASWVASLLEEPDRQHLIAAAWVHDIGYSPRLRRTGLHQLDGAAFVRQEGCYRSAALGAHIRRLGLKSVYAAMEASLRSIRAPDVAGRLLVSGQVECLG
jgi:hypothetical protein